MAMPMGSLRRTSIRRIRRETAMDAFPYRIPRVLESPRLSTSQGPAPMLAWIVRYTPKPLMKRLTAASSIFRRIARGERFCWSCLIFMHSLLSF